MNALHAGMLCTALLLGACMCLYGSISATVHHLRGAQLLHMAALLPNALALAVLISRLPACEVLPPRLWTGMTLLMLSVSAGLLLWHIRWTRRHISLVSIKTSCDQLPCALCFALENGQPCLMNLKMDEMSHLITGEALLNANTFWDALQSQPVVTLGNGQTWSFERTAMEIDGQRVYQIIGTDVMQSARLNRELEAENHRLDALNQRLREYSRNVQAVTREKELLRAKVRIHDELGHALLRTRQFLADGQGSAEEICASWQQRIRLLLGEDVEEAPEDAFIQLLRAAQAIGVTIHRQGVFPVEGSETAHLVELALHESLTNLVRHAGGTRLEVLGSREADGWHICCRNDGALPSGPIVEGGGLSSLRVQVEAAGGAMHVDHAPRFQLCLVLPEETEDLFG
ncbi:MAG: hypothetical protein PUC00_01455 [Clostridiales bacterium]|nr:hypothetical protein [Clostridiales bacterium]